MIRRPSEERTSGRAIRLPPFEDIIWAHRIELPDGRVTPGHWVRRFDDLGLEHVRFEGKRVLDIGCSDGLYSFHAEQRGASEVVSLDVKDEPFGYLYAHQMLESEARYVFPLSVYDLNASTFGQFDVVLFLGVIYHLVHPMLALERINEVLREGGVMVLDSEVSEVHTMFLHRLKHTRRTTLEAVSDSGRPARRRKIRDILRLALSSLTASGDDRRRWLPLWKRGVKAIIPEIYDSDEVYGDDTSNFWLPDRGVLQRMIDFCGFRIERALDKPKRVSYICRKVADVPATYAEQGRYSSMEGLITNFEPLGPRSV